MKANVFIVLLFFAFVTVNNAQSVKISPKKIVYKRGVSQDFENRNTFSVIYPQIESGTNSKTKRNIQKALDYNDAFDNQLKDAIGGDTYASEFYYKVNYNKSNILDVRLTIEAMGAYPWTMTKNIVINLKTGMPIGFEQLLNSKTTAKLNRAIQQKMRRELKLKKLSVENAFTFRENKKIENIGVKDLEGFSVSDKGITFLFDYNFNFASLSDEPDGRYFFSYAELKPFIKSNGAFAKFVR